MFGFVKIINLFLFSLCITSFIFAEKADVIDKDNKAQLYAIESAKVSRDIYLIFQKSHLFKDSFVLDNIDSLILLSKKAIELADSSLEVSLVSNKTAKLIMISAKEYQYKVLNYLVQHQQEKDFRGFNLITEKLVYLSGNSCVEAYKASLYFQIKEEVDDEKNDSENLIEEREITRLETDEFTYMSIKEIYSKRLLEIDKELVVLNTEQNINKNDKSIAIEGLERQLNLEREKCLKKLEGSENRLINVRNDLSKEMLEIVHKDIFTTDKDGFYNENVPVPIMNKFPDGLVYKLQIGFFKSQLPPEHFDGLFPLSSQKVDNTYYRYVAGSFPKYQDAKNAKDAVNEKGYTDSFVVAYFNGNKISISDAIKREKNK